MIYIELPDIVRLGNFPHNLSPNGRAYVTISKFYPKNVEYIRKDIIVEYAKKNHLDDLLKQIEILEDLED